MSRLQDVIQRGTRAAQPTASSVPVGTIYFVTSENVLERSSGSAWESISAVVASSSFGGSSSGFALSLLREIEETEPVIPYGSQSAIPTIANRTRQIGIVVDGGGSVLTTGFKGFKSFSLTGTITKVRLLADQSGSIVIDIWKDTYANFPPTVADTITASAKPTLSSAQKAEDSTLTGWTTAVVAGDVFGFNIDSITTITRILLELTIVII